jgi:hypothetical protein
MNIGELIEQAEQWHWSDDEIEAERERLRRLDQLLKDEIQYENYLG